jgi:FKBP-type peptidyl-prolyl cis-trans isomerase
MLQPNASFRQGLPESSAMDGKYKAIHGTGYPLPGGHDALFNGYKFSWGILLIRLCLNLTGETMLAKYVMTIPLIISLTDCTTTTSSTKPEENKSILQSDRQKSSYAQGFLYMKNLQQNETPLDPDLFLLGVNDVLNQTPSRLNPEQLTRGRDWVYVQQMLYMDRTSKKNIAKGEAFLKDNKNKDGVVSLPSGVQYKILTKGKSKQKPILTDTVSMHYKITKLNGELFYSTEKEPEAPGVQVNTMIKGWQEALLLMPTGSKWELYVPGPLAYGDNVAPEGKIEPNETMIINVELTGINMPVSAKAKTKALTYGPDGDIKPSSRW